MVIILACLILASIAFLGWLEYAVRTDIDPIGKVIQAKDKAAEKIKERIAALH